MSSVEEIHVSSAKEGDFVIERTTSISQIDPAEWDACVPDDNPFVRHSYLSALELGGVAIPQKGYAARHLLIRQRNGRLVAASPLYLKSHSDAEIGSDFGWSLAHERAVGPYYPKLQVESPVTPIPGPRLLVRRGNEEVVWRATLVDALLADLATSQASSLHLTFLKPDEWHYLETRGFLCDIGLRFVWHNRGYSDFNDFLSDLKGDHRGMIRRERRECRGTRLTFERVEDNQITSKLIDEFIPLYKSTYAKYDTPPLLTTDVFHRLRVAMQANLMFTVARLDGDMVAATMFMHGGECLVALHWGTSIDQRFLHYELVYYQGIEFAIERGYNYLDGGPGGSHKPNRGLPVTPSLHAHVFRDVAFTRMLVPGLAKRIETVRAQMAELDRISALKPGLGLPNGGHSL